MGEGLSKSTLTEDYGVIFLLLPVPLSDLDDMFPDLLALWPREIAYELYTGVYVDFYFYLFFLFAKTYPSAIVALVVYEPILFTDFYYIIYIQ